ncbi:MAG: M28 family peptidase [Longimicrobiales bacterium]
MLRTHTLAAAVFFVGAALSCTPTDDTLTLDQGLDSLSIDTFLAHMTALSSDVMSGRQPGTAGYDSAAAYVARESQALGLEPGGVSGTYLQPIDFLRASLDPTTAALSVSGRALMYGTDYTLSPRTTRTEIDLRASMVFAGFGISAPGLGYDDFDGIDVSGKLVVVMAGAPDDFGSLERTVLSSSASRDAELRERGAIGVVIVQPDEFGGRERPRVRYVTPDAFTSDASSPEELEVSLTVPRRVAAPWMEEAGRSLDDVVQSIRAGRPVSFELGIEARVRATFRHESFASPNVAALLEGSDPVLRDEVLVLTAHLDHLGIGVPIEGDSIYNGTLDNASGSAALLTLASVLTRLDAPRRSILFLWVTAEEVGLLGSEYFARFPSIGPGRVVANQNMDGVMGMITASSDVLAFGYEHSNLSEAVDFAVGRTGTPVAPDPTPEENLFIRSDQYAFVRQGIPAIWVQGGRSAIDARRNAQAELDAWILERYHKPTDDLEQPLDLEGVRRELHSNLLVTWHVTNEMGPIEWDPDSFLYQRWVRD